MNRESPRRVPFEWLQPAIARSRDLVSRATHARAESRELLARARLLVPPVICSQCGVPIDIHPVMTSLPADACPSCGRSRSTPPR